MGAWLAQGSGNWSSIVWNTNSDGSGTSGTPASGDWLYANGYDVTLDNSIDASGMTFIAAGGTFSIPAGASMSPSGPFNVGDASDGTLSTALSVFGRLDCAQGVYVKPASVLLVAADGNGNIGSLTGVYSPNGGVVLAAALPKPGRRRRGPGRAAPDQRRPCR